MKLVPGRGCKQQVIPCAMEIACLSGGRSHVRSGAGRTPRQHRPVVGAVSAWCSLTCFQHVQTECTCAETNGFIHHNGQVASRIFLQRNLRSKIDTIQQEHSRDKPLLIAQALMGHLEVEIIMSNHISLKKFYPCLSSKKR